MISIFIQGIQNGLHKIDISAPVSEEHDLPPEFFGNISITGELRKLGNRFTLVAQLECSAKLICDRSLEEYVEVVSAEFKTAFIANGEDENRIDKDTDWDDEVNIGIEEKKINISSLVREVLFLNLPMKRISPEYRDKEFEDLYPEYTARNTEDIEEEKNTDLDERWAPLKNLKLN
jgi:uncharacterized metal-binding protein YceD (DUF177 family)